MQMGVQRLYLDASNELATDKWLSSSMGFREISTEDYEMLVMQHPLVEYSDCAAGCLKVIPSKAALLDKVSPAKISNMPAMPNMTM